MATIQGIRVEINLYIFLSYISPSLIDGEINYEENISPSLIEENISPSLIDGEIFS